MCACRDFGSVYTAPRETHGKHNATSRAYLNCSSNGKPSLHRGKPFGIELAAEFAGGAGGLIGGDSGVRRSGGSAGECDEQFYAGAARAGDRGRVVDALRG